MLKTRLMPTLLHRDFGLVKGIRFDSWRHIGAPLQAVRVYNMRGVDELVFLDITATRDGRRPDFMLVDDLADECFMPLTVGGGIRSTADVEELLAVGADKVALNTAAMQNPALITDIADTFGRQCVVMSIDARRTHSGDHVVCTHSGTVDTAHDPVAWARECERRGAGEILITSIDRDGTMTGYDLPLIRSVADAVKIPVIASGGAGGYDHMAEAILEGGADAVAAASMFHFTERTPQEAKRHLAIRGIPVRL